MVRFAMLAALLAALWTAAPAEAGALPGNLDTTATAAVEQTTATVAAVTPTVGGATTAAPAAPSADPVVRTAAGAAGAAAESAAVTASEAAARTTQPPTSPGQGVLQDTVDTGELAQAKALSSTRDRGPVRKLRAGRARAHTGGGEPGPSHPSRTAAALPSADPDADGAVPLRASAGAGQDNRSASPEPAPTAGGGAAASTAAGFAAVGLALLAAGLCLAGPRLRRRLLIPPGLCRPVVFVSLLERPG